MCSGVESFRRLQYEPLTARRQIEHGFRSPLVSYRFCHVWVWRLTARPSGTSEASRLGSDEEGRSSPENGGKCRRSLLLGAWVA
jgi:hypothetical protein